MFIERLTDEVERSNRYRRPFALLLLQAPAGAATEERSRALRRAVAMARRHFRATDRITSFERAATLAMLLPETGQEAARLVLDRFAAEIAGAGPAWTLKLAAWPEDTDVINYFVQRAARLLHDGSTAASITKDLDADGEACTEVDLGSQADAQAGNRSAQR
jgi:hypothetical protein